MTHSLASHVKPEVQTLVGRDGQFDQGRVRLKMMPGMPREDARRDLSVITAQMTPAGVGAVAPILAVLKARTKDQRRDADEGAFAAEVMATDLAAYPVDVVEWVCEYWVQGGADRKWMPSWPELRDLCERRVQPRRALVKALQWVVAGEPVNAIG